MYTIEEVSKLYDRLFRFFHNEPGKGWSPGTVREWSADHEAYTRAYSRNYLYGERIAREEAVKELLGFILDGEQNAKNEMKVKLCQQ